MDARNILVSAVSIIVFALFAILNDVVLHWVILYPSTRTTGLTLTFLIAGFSAYPWEARTWRRWIGLATAAAALPAFYLLDDVLVSPGYTWLNRSAGETFLGTLYGFIFGAPAWTLKAIAMQRIKPGGIQLGGKQVLPPAEGLEIVHKPRNPKFDVVFIHGIHGSSFDTWSIDGTRENYWPAWVAEDFPQASVYSVHYNAFITRWKGHTMPLEDRAPSVLEMFDNEHLFKLPVIFIVHSFGGLVLKEIWRLVNDRERQDAIASMRGVVFLATPHNGAALATFLLYAPAIARVTVTAPDLEQSGPHLRKLNEWYRDHPLRHNFVHYETQPTPPINKMIVDESSADPGIPKVYPVSQDANHISICKPINKSAELVKSIRRYITSVFEDILPAEGGPDQSTELREATARAAGDSSSPSSPKTAPAPEDKPEPGSSPGTSHDRWKFLPSSRVSKAAPVTGRVLTPQVESYPKSQSVATTFSWLHLTDLHLGMAEQASLFPALKDKFFEDLKRLHETCGPWDLVLFTGDLTQSGTQFAEVDAFLTELWDRLKELGSTPSLLAVPGNHDLLRPDQNAPEVVLLGDWESKPIVATQFWNNQNSPYRKTVTATFQNYVDWWTKVPKLAIQHGMLPGDFSATFGKDGATLGIVGLNTTFLQLTGGDYKGRLALNALQFQKACHGDGPAWVKKHNACLLLTHQPPDWLTSESRDQIRSEIAGYFDVHLFGHMHEARYQSTAEAGGAPYRTSQGMSLFGLEYFGEEQKQARLHGYAAAKIETPGRRGVLSALAQAGVSPWWRPMELRCCLQ